MSDIVGPTLLVDRTRALANLRAMSDKAERCGVRLRPHAKTHACPDIAQWYRMFGITRITVSSLDMAGTFARAGWSDILVAFPVNVRALATVDELAERVEPGVVVDSVAAARALASGTHAPMSVWIEIDVGYGRTGVPWSDDVTASSIAKTLVAAGHLRLCGLLSHAGHSYRLRSHEDIRHLHDEVRERMCAARSALAASIDLPMQISLGDTPTCGIATDFTGVDEIRPGNFVFYDLQQLAIGSCQPEQLASALACPVVGRYPERGEIVVHGGSVHLSKDHVLTEDSVPIFGRLATLRPGGWQLSGRDNYVRAISQEHGTIRVSPEVMDTVRVGDIVLVIPAHACLAVNAMRTLRALDGRSL